MTQAVPAPSAPERVAALDGVRGLAILLVVVMHCTFFGYLLPSPEPLGPDHPVVRVTLLGWCGVDIFFVLSGFLITGILLRSKEQRHYFRDFYARRALRIFPLYYAVIVLLLFVLDRPAATTSERVSYLLYYQNLRLATVGEVHGDIARIVTWSLAIEEQFYLVWPAIVLVASRRTLAAICALAIALSIALRFFVLAGGLDNLVGPHLRIGAHFFTLCRMDALAAGACLALVPLPPPWFGRLAAGLGAASLPVIAFASGGSLPETMGMQRWGLIAALLLAVGVLVLARGSDVVARLFTNRALRSLGKYSYCIYLTHLLVIETIAKWITAPQMADARTWISAKCSGGVVLAAFTLLSLGAAWLLGFASWHLYEKHFLALKRFFSGTGPKK